MRKADAYRMLDQELDANVEAQSVVLTHAKAVVQGLHGAGIYVRSIMVIDVATPPYVELLTSAGLVTVEWVA